MMLASTMQFSKYKQSQHPDRRQPQPANMTSTAEAVQRNAGLTQKNKRKHLCLQDPTACPASPAAMTCVPPADGCTSRHGQTA
jgi:hypothetical protein